MQLLCLKSFKEIQQFKGIFLKYVNVKYPSLRRNPVGSRWRGGVGGFRRHWRPRSPRPERHCHRFRTPASSKIVIRENNPSGIRSHCWGRFSPPSPRRIKINRVGGADPISIVPRKGCGNLATGLSTCLTQFIKGHFRELKTCVRVAALETTG